MDIEILERKRNPLLNREEIYCKVTHNGEATPSRETVAAKLAAIINADRSRTVLKEIKGQFGLNESLVYANVYDSEEDVKVEPKYILKRNGLIGEDE